MSEKLISGTFLNGQLSKLASGKKLTAKTGKVIGFTIDNQYYFLGILRKTLLLCLTLALKN